MAKKTTNKKTCAADGKSAMQNEDILNILSSALGINADKLKQAIAQVNNTDTTDRTERIIFEVNKNTDKHFGTTAIKYSVIKRGIPYRENGFLKDREFITLKRSREYYDTDTIVNELKCNRWVIRQLYPDGKLPKEVKEAINDLHSLL